MACMSLEFELAASREVVWAVIGEFGALAEWHPMVPNCTLSSDGLTRTITLPGVSAVEVLDPEASSAWSHTYTVVSSPMPLEAYRATLSVESIERAGGGSRVKVSSTFKPVGVDEATVVAMLEGFFRAGFKQLQARFGHLPHTG